MAKLHLKKEKRVMDQPLNLIPFISFLSVVVCFLIAGATWVQLAQIEIALPSAGAAQQPAKDPKADLTLSLIVAKDYLRFTTAAVALKPIKNTDEGKHDLEQLDKDLKEFRKNKDYGQSHDMILLIQSSVIYEDLIHVMDACIRNEFDGISLAPWTSPEEIKAMQKKGK